MSDISKYRTRTLMKDKANGGIKDRWLCAVDYGYSSVKVFSQNRIAVYPSFAVRFDGDIVGTPAKEHILYRDLDTGQRWIVGEAAQAEVSQDDTTIAEEAVFGRARYDDPMFLVIVRVGLGIGCTKNEYGDPDGKPVYVQTGLPPKYLKQDTPLLVDAIAGRHRFSLTIGAGPEVIYDITVPKGNVDVMEQPKGTLYSIAKDNAHRFVPGAGRYFNSSLIILDGGFGTLDVYPIRNNHVMSRQTFSEFSMRTVMRKTLDAILDKYGTEISMVGLQKCLADGYFRQHGKFSAKNQPFSEELEVASREVCDNALNYIAQIYPLYEYDYFVVTGGTGAAWNEYIREMLKDIDGLTVIAGNQTDTALPYMMANARGYYMFLYDKGNAEIRR